ncbi:MAG: DMT family transporter [Rhizobiales bacterium]|nr:DMT family transporter [Hyphomicrobiales bacterium]
MLPSPPITDHKKGLAIAALGGVLIACDIPLVRLAGSDPWTVMLVRGPLMFAVLYAVYRLLKALKLSNARFIDGWDTVILAILHMIATVGFVLGIYYTTTANLVFITAFSSLVAIVFTTFVLRERHPLMTWLTVFVALVGILIITIDDLVVNSGANTFGNLMALLCAVMLAAETVFIRRSGKNLVYSPALAGLLAALVAVPFVMIGGFTLQEPAFLVLNSVFVAPLAMAMFALAPRYISAPEVAMFYLLETVLAPLMVWSLFDETLSTNTLIGGAIVIGAILVHSLLRLRSRPAAVAFT